MCCPWALRTVTASRRVSSAQHRAVVPPTSALLVACRSLDKGGGARVPTAPFGGPSAARPCRALRRALCGRTPSGARAAVRGGLAAVGRPLPLPFAPPAWQCPALCRPGPAVVFGDACA